MSKDTPAEEVNKAEGKYSWEKISNKHYYVWHKEGIVTTFIASTDTAEKAHLLATGANAISADAGKEQEAVAFAEWISLHSYIPSGDSDLNWILYLGELTDSSEKYTSQQLYTLYKQNK